MPRRRTVLKAAAIGTATAAGTAAGGAAILWALVNPVGLLGDLVCVNGTPAAFHEVTTDRVRLRLLNASNSRVYRLGFADNRPFELIGTDGGLLATPHETRRVQLSPAERAEIVVAIRPGERVILRSYPPALGAARWAERFGGGDDTLDVLQLRAAADLTATRPLPETLARPPQLRTAAVAATRRFELTSFAINGRKMEMGRADFAATTGTVEHWEVVNLDDVPHNFHVHDVQFQVLTVDGTAPPPDLRGWKDTIYTPPQVRFRLALRLGEYADAHTPYMYHCHLLLHEDRGLMGQFLVLEPGQAGPDPIRHAHR